MQMFRVKAIHEMVQAATAVFVGNIGRIMSGEIEPGFELIKSSPCAASFLAKSTSRYSYARITAEEMRSYGNSEIRRDIYKGFERMRVRAVPGTTQTTFSQGSEVPAEFLGRELQLI
ncbi:MAG TPA: hypothetical protein VGE08_25770 [Steroidobacter sp.]|uniref:hypothetical protein n=1 Tax=Steroidobacter sp. TaxID=1978227 RepID=UPI002EDAFB22